MPYSRGDIVLVLYPNSDLVTAKKRPALVVQRDNLNSGLPQVVIAMLSNGSSSRLTVASMRNK